MKTKEKVVLLLNIIVGILIIYETITTKTLCSKFSIGMVILLFLIVLFKKRITIMEQKKYILLIGYVIMFIFNKIFEYDIRFVLKSLLIIAKIFSFPVIIYCIIKLFKNINKKYLKRFVLFGNILLSIILIIIMFISSSYTNLNILFFSLFAIYISLSEGKEKYVRQILLVIIGIIALLLKNQIVLILNLFFSILSLFDYAKTNKISCKSSYILILVLSILFFGVYQITKSDEIEYKYLNIVQEYQVFNDNININNISDLKNMFKYYSLSDILFGIDYYNINNNNISIIYVFTILGLLGFFTYIMLWEINLKKLDKSRFEILIILIYIAITNLLLEPIIAFILSMLWLMNLRDLSDEKCLFKKKTLLLLILVIITSFLGAYILFFTKENTNTKEEVILKIDDGLVVTNGYKLELLENKQKENDKVVEDFNYYELKKKNRVLAEVIYVRRNISDVIIEYITFNNKKNKLNIKLEVSDEKLDEILNFEDYNIDYAYSNLVGQNKLKLPIGYFKSDKLNMIIGRSIEYNILYADYNKNNKSTVYNLIDQKIDLKNNYKDIYINPNNKVDTYIIRSKKELFNNKESLIDFLNVMNSTSSWLKYSGNLYKIQYSIEPFTREGYGKILGRLIEREIYDKRNTDGSVIYEVLNENTLFSLYNYVARTKEKGVWLTDYTSTWLSNDYNTKAYYVDTRYNETIGYYLLNIYNKDKKQQYMDSFLEYADFIVDEWNGVNTYMVGNIKMLSDYFSDSNISDTHSSLNHQLALVNYLYKAYEITKNNEYLITADEILENILKFKEKWIRENGDLWYQVDPKGEFSEKDYEIVTLDDLIFTQNYLYEIKKEKNDIITLYIKSKVKYLMSNGIQIPKFDLDLLNKLDIDI